VEANEVARHWLRKDIRMLTRGMGVRKVMEDELLKKNKQFRAYSEEKVDEDYYKNQFIDVDYKSLLKNPIGELSRIYRFAGLQMTKELETAVQDHLVEENVHKKYGRHEYRLADFGLEPSDLVDPAFELFRPNFSSTTVSA